MGLTILTDSVYNSIGPGLVIIPIEDVFEELQTVAIWKAGAMAGSKKLFVDHLYDETSMNDALAAGAIKAPLPATTH